MAVLLMALSLYTGLHVGRGMLAGWRAWAVNGALLVQFPLVHSFLLSSKGRFVLTRLAPHPLGRPLSTTTFAAISSLQLLLCFGLWSPMGRALWVPVGPLRIVFNGLYAVSWGLLFTSMREAGLRLQAGSMGWRAVWTNRAPAFPPLPTQGLHGMVRQPIYISFSLILWTAPSFTPEKIALSVLWTIYCVVGSSMKEKRMAKIHGAAFRAYQQKVPFWIPCSRAISVRRNVARTKEPDCDVVVVGGGPVGLLLANLLGKAGKSVLLLETGVDTPLRSMAIGITPPSLDILADLQLDDAFIRSGQKIHHAVVCEQGMPVGRLSFGGIEGVYDYILSLPQSETITLLRAKLASWPNVRVLSGWRVTAVRQEADGVYVTAAHPQSGSEQGYCARLAAGCDGSRSAVCEWLNIRKDDRKYPPSFVMADFRDRSELGQGAYLFFGPERPVESFPLPDGKRRWIVRNGWKGQSDLLESLESAVMRLTGIRLAAEDKLDESSFQPERKRAVRFFRGRVALCGDAAHVMSPIGGQGMNTGFGDAAFLARAFTAILDGQGTVSAWMRHYDHQRQRAFRLAAFRSACGMRLGVGRGIARSWLRRLVIRFLLRHEASRLFIARWFTMRSLPHPLRQLETSMLLLKT
ncbi:MAG TPA: FAD-dependent monooxygenase [Kiritimatiellia bacterium]|nr:FAD-dependent monooxygenase [Kiritimatiellia bacterium]HMP00655.1 FAD-dependent monooxygenase [Kiritimatiellia bacterium]HMP91109.1 FAD-dependent monooxygenase [Kiritimatiellia bacterium]